MSSAGSVSTGITAAEACFEAALQAVKDGMACQVRGCASDKLLRELGRLVNPELKNGKTATLNAIHTVLSYIAFPDKYRTRKEACEAHKASEKNYYEWKKRIREAVPAAAAAMKSTQRVNRQEEAEPEYGEGGGQGGGGGLVEDLPEDLLQRCWESDDTSSADLADLLPDALETVPVLGDELAAGRLSPAHGRLSPVDALESVGVIEAAFAAAEISRTVQPTGASPADSSGADSSGADSSGSLANEQTTAATRVTTHAVSSSDSPSTASSSTAAAASSARHEASAASSSHASPTSVPPSGVSHASSTNSEYLWHRARAPCARAGCSCVSFDGLPGHHCGRACRGTSTQPGKACVHRNGPEYVVHPVPREAPQQPSSEAVCIAEGCTRHCLREQNGHVREFCGLTCARAHAAAHSGTFAPCVRPGCPCTASYDGRSGEHCCDSCRLGGMPCTENFHFKPLRRSRKGGRA